MNVKNEHQFEPRYDEIEEINQEALDKGIKFWKEDSTSFQVDSKIKRKVYLYDIFIRCGLKVKRR